MAAAGKSVPHLTPSVMTADEVAELLHVHKAAVYRLLKAGQIHSFRIGSEYRFTRQAIDEWRRAQEATNQPHPPGVGRKHSNG